MSFGKKSPWIFQQPWNLELYDSEKKGESGVEFINPINFGLGPGNFFNGTKIRVAFNKLKNPAVTKGNPSCL